MKVLVDVYGERRLVLALLVGHDDGVLSGIGLTHVRDVQRDPSSGSDQLEFSGLFFNRFSVLHPECRIGRFVEIGGKGCSESAIECRGFRERLKVRAEVRCIA